MSLKYFLFLLICLAIFTGLDHSALAQIDDNKFKTDTIPELELEEEEEIPDKSKKKKKKKKVFYGMKCKRGFTKSGAGEKLTIETFFYLKEYREPNQYASEIYVWDIRKGKILKVSKITDKDRPFYKILHGPYKKMMKGEILEEGIYYVGTKHGRWEKYGKDNILIDKAKYYKGWPKESKITYYDAARTQIKEVIPYAYNKLDGEYFLFNEQGQVLIYGKYIEGFKVGVWVEYYEVKYRRKKEIKYPGHPYRGEQFEPFTLTEWDENGKMIIQNGKEVDNTKKGKKP